MGCHHGVILIALLNSVSSSHKIDTLKGKTQKKLIETIALCVRKRTCRGMGYRKEKKIN